jgi:ABC-type branched-subunit amino acid transport system substrate-binding protein
MDDGDKYFSLGHQIANSYKLWADWVNLEKGGIEVGSEKWGVKVTKIEDYSTTSYVQSGANALLTSQFDIDFFFGPYSSGLTGPMIDITDPAKKLLMSAGSNLNTVWDGTVEYAWGLLYPDASYYTDAFAAYKGKGASTIGFICNSQSSGTTCSSTQDTAIAEAAAANGMTVSYTYKIDSSLSTYSSTLTAAITEMASAASPPDVLVLYDYATICKDAYPIMQSDSVDWTPEGVFLVVCNNDATVQAAIGSSIAYATSYTSWSKDLSFTSGGWTSLH